MVEVSLLGVLHLLTAGATLVLLYGVSKAIYNVYFHPLAAFPGPKLAAISNLYYALYWPGGRWPFHLEGLHKKYGDVVRYAPNDLDFATPQSWQDIHGHIKQGKQTFIKGGFYGFGDDGSLGIVATRDPERHRELRKLLSHAFSAKALRLQADVVNQYVDMFIALLKRLGNTPEGVVAEEFYNWLTFDIIGDLAFGESFGALENAQEHPWVAIIKLSFQSLIYPDLFRRVPLLKLWPSLVRPKRLVTSRSNHLGFARKKMERRMEMNNDRDDFFSHLLSDKAMNLSPEFLTGQAQTLVAAGSDTTATFMSGTTYYLLKNPSTLKNLTEEVRSAFKDAREINAESTQSLRYLFAVIEEGLRIYPPVPFGLQRISPGSIVDGHWVPAGIIVSSDGWTTARSENYFYDATNFHPERWLPHDHPLYDDKYSNDVKSASNPFSLGPRACLGINLAYMEMRIILSRLVWEFDLELISKDVDWERDGQVKLLWVKPKLRVRFKPVAR